MRQNNKYYRHFGRYPATFIGASHHMDTTIYTEHSVGAPLYRIYEIIKPKRTNLWKKNPAPQRYADER
jgi:hypothetical protein